MAIVEGTSVTVVEITAASAVSSTSLPAAASPAEALVAAAKAAGRKGVVALASKVKVVNLGGDRAQDPSAGRIQAAVFASERFGQDAVAALVGWLVVSPDVDDDYGETIKALLKEPHQDRAPRRLRPQQHDRSRLGADRAQLSGHDAGL